MKTFPLNSISLQEAMELQFKAADSAKHCNQSTINQKMMEESTHGTY